MFFNRVKLRTRKSNARKPRNDWMHTVFHLVPSINGSACLLVAWLTFNPEDGGSMFL
jgi:hypothetical protein